MYQESQTMLRVNSKIYFNIKENLSYFLTFELFSLSLKKLAITKTTICKLLC